MRTFYTVGDYPRIIQRRIAKQEIYKSGKSLDYSGGIVFRTIECANKYILSTKYNDPLDLQ
jgi:hypothetical protein